MHMQSVKDPSSVKFSLEGAYKELQETWEALSAELSKMEAVTIERLRTDKTRTTR